VKNLRSQRTAEIGNPVFRQSAFHCGDPCDIDIKDDSGMVAERVKSFQVAEAEAAVTKWLGKQ